MLGTSLFLAGRRWIEGVAAYLAPSRCRCCQAPLLGFANPYLCADCAAAVQWIGEGACLGCGFPAGPHARHIHSCFRCRGGRLNLTGAVSVARYRGGVRNLVMSLKFRGETELARPLGALMAARLRGSAFASRFDVILPVALHPERRRLRGFDQARLLAGQVARLCHKPMRTDLVHRALSTRPQASLSRHDRLSNVQGAFRVAGEALAGARVLLVDDVMTTGATMAECAKACREAGAVRVYGLTFAR